MMRIAAAALAALFTAAVAVAAPAENKSDAPEVKKSQPIQGKSKRRIGSSTPPSLTPVQPHPTPGVAPLPPSARIGSALPPAPLPQSPYLGSRGAYPVPSRQPGESFGDRVTRCQHSATVSGVRGSERGAYLHNCM